MKPLPEERLLKLLRAKPKPGPDAAAREGKAPPGAPAGGVSAMVVSFPKRSPVTAVAAAFGLVLAVEAVAVVVQLARPLPPVTAATPAPAPAAAEEPLPAPSVSASAARPLFTPPAETAASSGSARRAPPSGAAKELAARLTLLGIIAGDPPQAIIEDSESKKSYFVAQGQQILEGAMLDAVFDTYVVLDLSGEKFELRL